MKSYLSTYNLSGAMANLSDNPVFSELVGGDKIMIVTNRLVKCWKSPSRFYHSIGNHLLPMLWKIKNMRIDEHSRNLLEITAWFHDCKYSPRAMAGLNEENSMKFFQDNVTTFNDDVETISEMIKMTKDFSPESCGNDILKIKFARLDLDYLKCSADVSRIVKNELLVMKEFQFVDYSLYKKLRLGILKKLLDTHVVTHYTIDTICRYLENHRPRIGIYPGSFDPFHKGHLSVLKEAEKIFDKVIVAIGTNPAKQTQGSMTQISKVLPYHQIERFRSYLHEYVEKKSKDADITIIRGFRSGYDIDYELGNLAFMRDMSEKDVNMIFIAPQKKFDHVSSSAIRAMQNFGKKKSKLYIPKPYCPKM